MAGVIPPPKIQGPPPAPAPAPAPIAPVEHPKSGPKLLDYFIDNLPELKKVPRVEAARQVAEVYAKRRKAKDPDADAAWLKTRFQDYVLPPSRWELFSHNLLREAISGFEHDWGENAKAAEIALKFLPVQTGAVRDALHHISGVALKASSREAPLQHEIMSESIGQFLGAAPGGLVSWTAAGRIAQAGRVLVKPLLTRALIMGSSEITKQKLLNTERMKKLDEGTLLARGFSDAVTSVIWDLPVRKSAAVIMTTLSNGALSTIEGSDLAHTMAGMGLTALLGSVFARGEPPKKPLPSASAAFHAGVPQVLQMAQALPPPPPQPPKAKRGGKKGAQAPAPKVVPQIGPTPTPAPAPAPAPALPVKKVKPKPPPPSAETVVKAVQDLREGNIKSAKAAADSIAAKDPSAAKAAISNLAEVTPDFTKPPQPPPAETPKAKAPMRSNQAKILDAIQALEKETGSRDHRMLEIAQKAGLTKDAAVKALENLHDTGHITMSRGDWSLSTPEERAHAVYFENEPYMRAEINRQASEAAPAPAAPPEPEKTPAQEEKAITFLRRYLSDNEGIPKESKTLYAAAKKFGISGVKTQEMLDSWVSQGRLIREETENGEIHYTPTESIDPEADTGLTFLMGLPLSYLSARRLARTFKFLKQETLGRIAPATTSPEAAETWARVAGTINEWQDWYSGIVNHHATARWAWLSQRKSRNNLIFDALEGDAQAYAVVQAHPLLDAIHDHYKALYEQIADIEKHYGMLEAKKGNYVFHAIMDPRDPLNSWASQPNWSGSGPGLGRMLQTRRDVEQAGLKLLGDGNLETLALERIRRFANKMKRMEALKAMEDTGFAAPQGSLTHQHEITGPDKKKYFLNNVAHEFYTRSFTDQTMPFWTKAMWGVKRMGSMITLGIEPQFHALHLMYNVATQSIAEGKPWKAVGRIFGEEIAKKHPGILEFVNGRREFHALSASDQEAIRMLRDSRISVREFKPNEEDLFGPRSEAVWRDSLNNLDLPHPVKDFFADTFFGLHHVTFGKWIPLMKMQYAMHLWEDAYRDNPALLRGSPEYWRVADRIGKQAVDRFGQVSYGVHGGQLPALLKNTVGAAMISAGWQWSFLRRIIGKPLEGAAKAATFRLSKAEARDLLHTAAYVTTWATLCGVWNAYKTGQQPSSFSDLTELKLHQNPDGTWTTFGILTFLKEFPAIERAVSAHGPEGLAEWAEHKVTPGLGILIDLGRNTDAFNRQLWGRTDPEGRPYPWYEQGKQALEDAALRLGVPMSFQQVVKPEATPLEYGLALIGGRPSRTNLFKDPLQQDIANTLQKLGRRISTYSEAERIRAAKILRKAEAEGDQKTIDRIQEDFPRLTSEVTPEAKTVAMFRQLPAEEQIRILRKYQDNEAFYRLLRAASPEVREKSMR